MLDLNGFLLSTEFLAQIASIITALLSTIFSDLIASLFGGL